MEHEDEWPIIGEVPGDERLVYVPAHELFERKSEASDERIAEGHELATEIDSELVRLDGVIVEQNPDKRTYSVQFIREHKKGITEVAVATLTVAGLLAAAHQIRVRRKK